MLSRHRLAVTAFLEPERPMMCLAGPWKVLQRWLTDSVVYNEWMNPIDYETEEALAEQEAAGRQLPGD